MSKLTKAGCMLALTGAVFLGGLQVSAHSEGLLPRNGNAGWLRWCSRAHDLIGTIVVIAGFLAAAVAARKGKGLHVSAGKLYLLGMGLLALSVMPMLIASPSSLQLILTALALYLSLTGVIRIKALTRIRGLVSPPVVQIYTPPQRGAPGVVRQLVQFQPPRTGWTDRLARRSVWQAAACVMIGLCLAALFPSLHMSWTASYAAVPANILALLGLALAALDLLDDGHGLTAVQSHIVRMLGSLLILLSAGFFNICATFGLLEPIVRWLVPAIGSLTVLSLTYRYFYASYCRAAATSAN